MSTLGAWLEALSPGRGAAIAAAFDGLDTMPVYREPEGPLSDDDRRLLGAELSLRAHGPAVDLLRVMVALRRDRLPAGALGRALGALSPGFPRRPVALADKLVQARPDLDVLLGADAAGDGVRGKIYLLRPALRPIADFDELTAAFLEVCGVPRAWTAAQRALAGVTPAFFAIDLHPGGRAGGKLYFAFDDPARARGLLEALDRPWLAERLEAVLAEVSDNPVGRLVVTARGRGDRTADVTLHAHTARVPAVSPPLADAFARLEALAAAELGRPLRPSYVSWLDGPARAESLYYQIGLRPR